MKKRILSLLLAIAMILSLGVSVYASEDIEEQLAEPTTEAAAEDEPAPEPGEAEKTEETEPTGEEESEPAHTEDIPDSGELTSLIAKLSDQGEIEVTIYGEIEGFVECFDMGDGLLAYVLLANYGLETDSLGVFEDDYICDGATGEVFHVYFTYDLEVTVINQPGVAPVAIPVTYDDKDELILNKEDNAYTMPGGVFSLYVRIGYQPSVNEGRIIESENGKEMPGCDDYVYTYTIEACPDATEVHVKDMIADPTIAWLSGEYEHARFVCYHGRLTEGTTYFYGSEDIYVQTDDGYMVVDDWMDMAPGTINGESGIVNWRPDPGFWWLAAEDKDGDRVVEIRIARAVEVEIDDPFNINVIGYAADGIDGYNGTLTAGVPAE